MRNRIGILASSLMLALVTSFASCGRSDDAPRDTTLPPPAPPVTDESFPTAPPLAPEIASVASPTFGVERLRSMVGTLSESELLIAANALSSALRHQETLSPEGQSLHGRLREKLDVVIDTMKARHMDVAEYGAEIGAEIR